MAVGTSGEDNTPGIGGSQYDNEAVIAEAAYVVERDRYFTLRKSPQHRNRRPIWLFRRPKFMHNHQKASPLH